MSVNKLSDFESEPTPIVVWTPAGVVWLKLKDRIALLGRKGCKAARRWAELRCFDFQIGDPDDQSRPPGGVRFRGAGSP
jgi:hypothetical protein